MRAITATLFLIAVLMVTSSTVLGWALKRYLLKELAQDSSELLPKIRSVKVHWFPMRVTIEGLTFASGDRNSTLVELYVPEVSTRIERKSKSQIFPVELTFLDIVVEKLQVIVTEGDKKSSRDYGPEPGSGLRAIASHLQKISINEAKFTYLRIYGGRSATIRLKEIQGSLVVADNEIVSNLKGRLEHSGYFTLALKVPRSLSNTDMDLKLEISKQDLADFKPYFRPAEGVILSGNLKSGSSTVSVRGPIVRTRVNASYEGLKVEFEKNYQRSEFSTFILNLGKSLSLRTQSLERPARTRSVQLYRNSDESILHFIFRSMGKAALDVAS